MRRLYIEVAGVVRWMVWCGRWCDEVVCGEVVCGEVVCGEVVCGVVVCGEVVCGVVVCGEVVCGEVLCSEVLCGEVLCGEVLCGVVVCGEVVCGEVLCGEAWYSEVDGVVGISLCCVIVVYSVRQRIEREEREELRKKGIPSWKEKTFMPDELAGRLEQDRRNFQMRTLDVCGWGHTEVSAHV